MLGVAPLRTAPVSLSLSLRDSYLSSAFDFAARKIFLDFQEKEKREKEQGLEVLEKERKKSGKAHTKSFPP